MHRNTAALLPSTLLLAACVAAGTDPATSLPTASAEATASQAIEAQPSFVAVPTPAATPTLPEPLGLAYTCGAELRFDAAAFDGPTGAEFEDHPSAAAIRDLPPFHETSELRPPWRLAARTEVEALYLSGDRPAWYARVERRAGAWTLTGWGDCAGWLVSNDDMLVTWWLADPDTFGADSVRVPILAATLCEAGPLAGRLQPPQIVYRETDVLVGLMARRPEPTAEYCSEPEVLATEIQLGEPLGDRALLDASVWPPRDARFPPGP